MGGTCRTMETRLCDLPDVKDERVNTGDRSDLMDLLSLKFLDTAGTEHK